MRVCAGAWRAQIRPRFDRNATRGSAVPAIPVTYGARECRWGGQYQADRPGQSVAWSTFAYSRLFGRQDRNRDCVLLGAGDLQHEGPRRELVFHGLADAVAIGRAAEGPGFEEMPVLHHVDPGARREADGVDAGLRRALEAGEPRHRAVLGRAFGR